MPIEAVNAIGALFDWDGVIVDSSGQHERAWEMLADELGKPLPDDHFHRSFGMTNRRIIPKVFGWNGDDDAIEAWSDRKEALYRELIAKDGVQALPGVVRLLRLLNDHEVPCSVCSSTSRENIETIFGAIDIGDCFQAVVSADDVKNGKPDPEVFLKGAARIRREPRNCIVFEDALVGIEAGRAAGARVIGVATTLPIERLSSAHHAVASLEDVDIDLLVKMTSEVNR